MSLQSVKPRKTPPVSQTFQVNGRPARAGAQTRGKCATRDAETNSRAGNPHRERSAMLVLDCIVLTHIGFFDAPTRAAGCTSSPLCVPPRAPLERTPCSASASSIDSPPRYGSRHPRTAQGRWRCVQGAHRQTKGSGEAAARRLRRAQRVHPRAGDRHRARSWARRPGGPGQVPRSVPLQEARGAHVSRRGYVHWHGGVLWEEGGASGGQHAAAVVHARGHHRVQPGVQAGRPGHAGPHLWHVRGGGESPGERQDASAVAERGAAAGAERLPRRTV
eukprot:ctg_1755.g491